MAFADPTSNLAQFDVQPGHQVADLGSGSGFYALAAARAVGSTGRVFAVDVQKELLDRVKNSAAREGIGNLAIVWGDIEKRGGTRLRDSSLDRVIVSNVLFQVEDREQFVQEISRILKSGGKVLLIDWSDSADISGPDPTHLIPKENARALLEAAGFSIEKEISAGTHHYGFVAVKG